MTFMGTMAIASPIWGALTQRAGLPTAVYTAAALTAVGAFAGRAVRIPESGTADRAALDYWNDPSLGIAPEPAAGPVQVLVEYHVAPADEAAWLHAMQSCAAHGCAAGRSAGSSTGSGNDPTGSSKCSPCRPGTSTNASTATG